MTQGQLWIRLLELAKKAATSEPVKTASKKHADALVTVVAGAVTTGGTAAFTRRLAKRKNRRLAVDLARQKGYSYSRAIIAGDRYWVVWQQETPFDVFPALPEGSGPLAERPELQNYQGTRKPSADGRWRPRLRRRPRDVQRPDSSCAT